MKTAILLILISWGFLWFVREVYRAISEDAERLD